MTLKEVMAADLKTFQNTNEFAEKAKYVRTVQGSLTETLTTLDVVIVRDDVMTDQRGNVYESGEGHSDEALFHVFRDASWTLDYPKTVDFIILADSSEWNVAKITKSDEYSWLVNCVMNESAWR